MKVEKKIVEIKRGDSEKDDEDSVKLMATECVSFVGELTEEVHFLSGKYSNQDCKEKLSILTGDKLEAEELSNSQ